MDGGGIEANEANCEAKCQMLIVTAFPLHLSSSTTVL